MAPGLGRRHSLASVVFMIWMIDSRRSVVEIGGFADEGHSAEAYELAAGRRGADGAALVGNHAGRLVQGFGIERGGQSDGLRKYGHLFAGAGHSVQAFVPPIV